MCFLKEIDAAKITSIVKDLAIQSNKILPKDLESLICKRKTTERNVTAKSVLGDLCANLDAARELNIPICQDTGMAIVFVEIGQDVHVINGDFEGAINEGIRQGYDEGLLRKSVVKDPIFDRVNTNDNTPAIIYTSIVPGEKIKITVAPKGFGSENMSQLKMFTPAASIADITEFVVDTVSKAGSNPCPPVIIGVGIGGDFEYCAYLSKLALCRGVSVSNSDNKIADLEQEMLNKINELEIGPQGFGGDTTALSVNIETYPTHIASIPVAVNVGCHVTRHATAVIE